MITTLQRVVYAKIWHSLIWDFSHWLRSQLVCSLHSRVSPPLPSIPLPSPPIPPPHPLQSLLPTPDPLLACVPLAPSRQGSGYSGAWRTGLHLDSPPTPSLSLFTVLSCFTCLPREHWIPSMEIQVLKGPDFPSSSASPLVELGPPYFQSSKEKETVFVFVSSTLPRMHWEQQGTREP